MNSEQVKYAMAAVRSMNGYFDFDLSDPQLDWLESQITQQKTLEGLPDAIDEAQNICGNCGGDGECERYITESLATRDTTDGVEVVECEVCKGSGRNE